MRLTAQQRYDSFLDSIDVSVAGTDVYGNLRDAIDCSALANASTMAAEYDDAAWEFYYENALATAEMCLNDWQSLYPQLILTEGV